MIMATDYLVKSRWKVGYDPQERFYYLEDTKPPEGQEGRLYSYFTVNEVVEIIETRYDTDFLEKSKALALNPDKQMPGWQLEINPSGEVLLLYSEVHNSTLIEFKFPSVSDFESVLIALVSIVDIWEEEDPYHD
jgi:hypothetical protein